MVIGFADKGNITLTDEFQKWRQSNLVGFFLTFGSRVVLHGTKCWHPGKVDWDCIEYRDGKKFKISLTKKRKVCSSNQAELLTWADREGVDPIPCSHCIRETLTTHRVKRIVYLEQLPAKKTRKPNLRQPLSSKSAEIGKILEGIVQEITTKRRSRSSKLRSEALRLAKGVCECCRTDFSKILNGLGVRVLQAHHRQQLSLADKPPLSGVEDLAVLCSNCHALIHFNMKSSLEVEELRKMLLKCAHVKLPVGK